MKIKFTNYIEISATQSPFINFAIGILIIAIAFLVILYAIHTYYK
jgi:uncharacterized membrane protein YidH (DUF202 family)